MDPETLFYVALAIYWVLSQFATYFKKNKARTTTTKQRPQSDIEHPLELSSKASIPRQKDTSIPALIRDLSDAEQVLEESLNDFDEKIRSQVNILTVPIKADVQRLRHDLTENSANEFEESQAQQIIDLTTELEDLRRTAHGFSHLRRQSQFNGSQLVADALLDDLTLNLVLGENTCPKPVAVFGDRFSLDQQHNVELRDSIVFTSPNVNNNPIEWALIAFEINRYIDSQATSFYQDIYNDLGLYVDRTEIATDSKALAKLFFSSWLKTITADAIGASLFGPSYLRAITTFGSDKSSDETIITIQLNKDGTVHATPPQHVRVHLTAEWVRLISDGSDAATILNEWNEAHNNPQRFVFGRSNTSIAAAPILEAVVQLMENLFALPIDSLGATRIVHLPGLNDWETINLDYERARLSLVNRIPSESKVRALVSAAIATTIESPDNAKSIGTCLIDSIKKPLLSTKSTTDTFSAYTPTPKLSPFVNLRGSEIAEAIVLSDVLLKSPRHNH